MNQFDLRKLVRKNILNLTPYSSARDEFKGTASTFLDANENSMGSSFADGYNRYPDPLQQKLKAKIAAIKSVDARNIFIGNGSDEPIDLLMRALCRPGIDNVLTFPPTYGMYDVSAHINDVAIKTVLLTEDFQIDTAAALNAIDDNTKLIFICSPNNPTGNLIDERSIEILLSNFTGIVVIDEAYIDFAPGSSWVPRLSAYPNLVILQTFSKAWGLAALRVGTAYASEEIVKLLNAIKAPYNINLSSQLQALSALENIETVNDWINILTSERGLLVQQLGELSIVEKVFPSDANFILARFSDARGVYDYLLNNNIVVRNRSNMPLCSNCLRITVGTPRENKQLIEALQAF